MTRLTADLFPRRGWHPNRKTSEYSAGRIWLYLARLNLAQQVPLRCKGAG